MKTLLDTTFERPGPLHACNDNIDLFEAMAAMERHYNVHGLDPGYPEDDIIQAIQSLADAMERLNKWQ